jgi:hypothetical protein
LFWNVTRVPGETTISFGLTPDAVIVMVVPVPDGLDGPPPHALIRETNTRAPNRHDTIVTF